MYRKMIAGFQSNRRGAVVSRASLAVVLVATALLGSLLTTSIGKYVLEPIEYELSLTATDDLPFESITSVSPVIGTTSPGYTLTAGTVLPLGATVTYQWQRADSPDGPYVTIPEATGKTFAVVYDDNNSYIRVAVTGAGEYKGTVYSPGVGPVVATPIMVTEMAPISGLAKAGETLTAGPLTPAEATATYQWEIASSPGGHYEIVPGATEAAFPLTENEVDRYLRVTATAGGIYAGTVSAVAGPIKSFLIPITAIGAISGTTMEGETLTAGTMNPADAEVDYQWQSCDSPYGIYTDIEGAVDAVYTLSADDLGRYLKVEVTGKNLYIGSATSEYTGPVIASSTPITAIGPISGTARVGETLTVGSLTPAEATATYQWEIADTASEPSFSPIAGAAGMSYPVSVSDLGKYIRVTAIGSGAYSGAVTSEPTAAVAAQPITSISRISGTTKVGEELSAGTVTPAGATVSYQWRRATSESGTYADISGATGQTYTLAAGDGGRYIQVRVTGTGAYAGTATSVAAGPVVAVDAGTTDITAIADSTGVPHVFQTLTAGTVAPYGATVTYQWYRSDTAAGIYEPISGATNHIYNLLGSDKGYYFKVKAIGSGTYTGSATSRAAGPITAAPLTAIGAVQGTTVTGNVLTMGSITPAAGTANYQWQRSDAAGENYADIAGATAKNYLLTEADLDCYLRVKATGTNHYSGTVVSAGVGPVTSLAIPVTGVGAIMGIPQVGQLLQAGATTPAGAMVTYQWFRATTVDGTYTPISGATQNTYALTGDDYNKFIKVEVKGAGTYAGTAISSATTAVALCPITGISNIIGRAEVDHILTAGTPVPYTGTVTYQWQRLVNGSYQNIAGATESSYKLTQTDNSRYIRVVVTGVNSAGYTGVVNSGNTGPVGSPNAIISISPITGITQVGEMLTAGIVQPYGSVVAYQWQRSDSADGTYELISGATGRNYTLTGDDYNKYLKVVASGSGDFFGETISAATDIVRKGTVAGMAPINGTTLSGKTLTAGTVTPSYATVTYQWQRSDEAGVNFTNIPGAAGSSLVLTDDDLGRYLRVTATGVGGFTGFTSCDTADTVGPGDTETIALSGMGATTGTAAVGQTLTAGSVGPSGATVTYQWERAAAAGGPYTYIAGATGSTYLLTDEDFGKYVRPTASGSGRYIGTVRPSTATNVNVRRAITGLGEIMGTPAVGEKVMAGAITPAGATVTYQWQRCTHKNKPLNPAYYADIDGATGSSYTLTAAEVPGGYIRLVVTGTGAYSGTLISTIYGLISEYPHKLVAISPVMGTAQVSRMLEAGVITPYGASVTYQWLRRAAGYETFSEIPGATDKTYVLTATDYNCQVKVVATGAGQFSGWVDSGPTALVAAGELASISPTVGAAAEGQTLTAGAVSPLGATVTYQWQRSDSDNPEGNYTNIDGATQSAYAITAADAGRFLQVIASGYGAYSGLVTSAAVGPATTSATEITAIGNITGTTQVLSTLSAGNVTPGGATVTYQWKRASDQGGPYAVIPGATDSTYQLQPEDWSKHIKVEVTGCGQYYGVQESAATSLVQPCPITGLGNFTGEARVGRALVAGPVTPEGATVTYTWILEKRDEVLGTTTPSLVVPGEFLGNNSGTVGQTRIRLIVTGTGAFSGSLQRDSDTLVLPATQAQTPLLAIGQTVGTTAVGETLAAGSLSPSGATVTYQWLRSLTADGTYDVILGATAPSYTIQADDLGYYLEVMAIGTGNYSGTVTAAAKGPVTSSDQTIEITGISDILYSTVPDLTLSAGTVFPLGATVTYQWQRSDSVNPAGSYTDILGATDSVYTIPIDQALGYYYKLVVTGSGMYTGTVASNYTGPVVATPTELISIEVSGVNRVGETLSAVNLNPAGATVTYQWRSATGPGGIISDIEGATNSTYTLRESDYNFYIQVVATGSGAYAGSVSAMTEGRIIGWLDAAKVILPAPVLGLSPPGVAEVEAATAEPDYTVTDLVWNEELTAEGKFKAGTVYTATIELTSKNYRLFVAEPFTPTVVEAESVGSTTTTDSEVGNKVSFTVTFPATEALEVASIEVTTPPKLIYTEGSDDALDLTGMVVTETLNDGSTQEIAFTDGTAAGYTTLPANGDLLTMAEHDGTTATIIHIDSEKTAYTESLTVGLELEEYSGLKAAVEGEPETDPEAGDGVEGEAGEGAESDTDADAELGENTGTEMEPAAEPENEEPIVETEPEAETDLGDEPPVDSDPEEEPAPDTEAEESDLGSGPEAEAEAEVEADEESVSEVDSDAQVELEPEADAEFEEDSGETGLEEESGPEAEPDTEREPETEGCLEAEQASEPETEAEP